MPVEVDIAQFLSEAGPAFLIALFVIVLIKGRYIVLRRELDAEKASHDQTRVEKDEYKQMAFRAVGLGERLADVAKDKKP